MIEILLASTNMHKILELRDMFKPLAHIELISLHQFPHYQTPEETGLNFKENAVFKAESAAKALNKWVLADDSGLVVPALNGEPGIYSSRYAGIGATDLENRKKLIESMKHLDKHNRTAYFECSLALADHTGLKKCVKGVCEGYLLKEPRGRYGFGYDSLFIKNDYEKTFAELDENIKNRISHRRKAFERLLSFLETMRVS